MAKQHQLVEEFEDYLNQVTERVSLGKKEKSELKEEWHQHLMDSMNHYIEKGLSEKEAIELSIQQFGAAELLQSEVNRSYLSARKTHFFKEGLIWLICLLAASIGPSLLIGAHYQLYFITQPLFLLFLCYVLYHVVIKRVNVPLLSLIGLPIFYGSFLFFFISRTSLEYFFQHIIPFDLEDVAGGSGLFTLPFLHLLWIFMIVGVFFLARTSKTPLRPIIQSSFEYWFMIMFALYVVNAELLTNSSEGKTIILNIFLLYVFLQQVIVPEFLIKSMNKVEFWLKKSKSYTL